MKCQVALLPGKGMMARRCESEPHAGVLSVESRKITAFIVNAGEKLLW